MNKFFEKLGKVSQKLGGEIHLRSLRDAFASLIPFIIIAGLMIFINYVVIEPTGFMSKVINPATLTTWQDVGTSINNGTLNFLAVLLAGACAYHLAINRKFENPIAPALLAISIFVILLPFVISTTPVGVKDAVKVAGVISYSSTNSGGMFVGIITSLLSTELFMWLSKNEKLKINIGGEAVPPAVTKSFNSLIPIMITILIFAVVSFAIKQLFGTDINSLILKTIQRPLVALVTSLPGFIILMLLSNLLFAIGIHPGGVIAPIMDPVLYTAMNENMTAFAQGQPIPHIISMSFKDTFGVMGGSGNTIALLIAIFLFSKRKDYRDIAKLSTAPGIFNINEPVIFGLPIVFDLTLMIPFVLASPICLTVAYLVTEAGWMSPVVIQTPWTTPPILSGFLATGGDWRASVFQIIMIALTVLLYIPFLKVAEKKQIEE
ncbi:PTS sugar transporter subunit IIC [Clostridium beijerinckii]|uniref:Permease IIC component n=1 Tax=Clostridium beijerinckii TaxID=1520 RepID=A0A1S8S460_CLOBE|nr:PTS transporter subunit EIIC [Clostridium beijerinckii]NRY59510.1 PTS system cellobiose-specific IIC component [Clostridium beijerinckii]OOM60266.1 lichenan permease IIC component [Clostridium beijerinckii]